MLAPLSVNETIENLTSLAGRDITVSGLFTFQFENVSISHWPKSESRGFFASSIWISTGTGALQFDQKTCQLLSGKRVLIQGTLYGPDPRMGGCGHMSGWPAEILARTLEAA
jgi:hypothetical protein